MKVSGFSYIRNGFTYGYPFIQSYLSILPVCDELIIAVGDSTDGTREAIVKLGPKVRIIDTVWDENNLRSGGRIFAEQCNIALKEISGDWGFHIQCDEVIHEKDLPKIRQAMEDEILNPQVEGFLLPFLHFFGDYHHIGVTRRWHRNEIRIIRNRKDIFSYRDSQGFRSYPSEADYLQNLNSRKLRVKKIEAPVYHYSYSRNPRLMLKKSKYFDKFWHNDQWIDQKYGQQLDFDYSQVDCLEKFKGSHPAVMQEVIADQDWEFQYDPSKTNFRMKERVLYELEKLTGWRIGEYKNYKLI